MVPYMLTMNTSDARRCRYLQSRLMRISLTKKAWRSLGNSALASPTRICSWLALNKQLLGHDLASTPQASHAGCHPWMARTVGLLETEA